MSATKRVSSSTKTDIRAVGQCYQQRGAYSLSTSGGHGTGSNFAESVKSLCYLTAAAILQNAVHNDCRTRSIVTAEHNA
jgi:hypothetical protein